ncbi:MAG TPA: hypothetical protein VFT31_07160 [Kribbella sp.]|nr:hypothetical protein [Kribbella sp.]
MAKLTEEETGRLLRETFAEKENLVDGLPAATIGARRPRAPVLLAAASVLLVLGGAVYAAGAGAGDERQPGVATSTVTRQSPSQTKQSVDVAVWAAVIREAAEYEQPAAGWPVLIVLDAPQQSAGDAMGRSARGRPFSDAVKRAIEDDLASIAPIQWVRERPVSSDGCDAEPPKGPVITVGPVVGKDGHFEVGVSTWRSCLDGRWQTSRVDRRGTSFLVTGTVGAVAVS